jgi:hypothetical protein
MSGRMVPHYIPEDSNLYIHHCKNLKSHIVPVNLCKTSLRVCHTLRQPYRRGVKCEGDFSNGDSNSHPTLTIETKFLMMIQ